MNEKNLDELKERIANLRREIEALAEQTEDFPALACNTARLLAGVRVMEIDLGIPSPSISARQSS